MQTAKENRLKVVIAGGGTAGWLAASALAQQMGDALDITLVESAEIGTVGVGEATIPPMKTFHRLLRINEQEFMKATHATFKLGIHFEDWKKVGESYFHSFGETGKQTLITEFIHFWLKGRELGLAKQFGSYCVEFKAAMEGRFSTQSDVKINHAYHLDAGLYAKYLKKIAMSGGVKNEEGKIVQVQQNNSTGFITALSLDSGKTINGDFFIDCTGFRGLLIEKTLKTEFEDWSHWLPCDRAVAVASECVEAPWSYTQSTAHKAGWQWRIPLQHRVGNGHVYASQFMSDDEAKKILLENINGPALTDPKLIRFKTGHRKESWKKNCLAIGLAAGFLEPLESTSLHLVQYSIEQLLNFFPTMDFDQEDINEYNKQTNFEFERIRDFIILHYKVTSRDDSDFWNYCRTMDIPKTLTQKINQYKKNGHIFRFENEMFDYPSWFQVMNGQGLTPQGYNPFVDVLSEQELEAAMTNIETVMRKSADFMPSHQDYINQHCKAGDINQPVDNSDNNADESKR